MLMQKLENMNCEELLAFSAWSTYHDPLEIEGYDMVKIPASLGFTTTDDMSNGWWYSMCAITHGLELIRNNTVQMTTKLDHEYTLDRLNKPIETIGDLLDAVIYTIQVNQIG